MEKKGKRKIIGAINITVDGFCDHTAVDPDAEIHQHYIDLLREADAILYGRITYQLMEFWRTLAEDPSGEKSMDDFAVVIDRLPKIVFSKTLENITWKSAELATKTLEQKVRELKREAGNDVLIGSRSLIIALLTLNLLDELQLMLHPVIAGGGLPLFENLNERKNFKLLKTKNFRSGAIVLYYQPTDR